MIVPVVVKIPLLVKLPPKYCVEEALYSPPEFMVRFPNKPMVPVEDTCLLLVRVTLLSTKTFPKFKEDKVK